MSGGSSGAWTVAMQTFSASPHVGVIASRLNPYAEKRRVKSSMVEASAGSEPLAATRQQERSRPTSSASGMRRAQSA